MFDTKSLPEREADCNEKNHESIGEASLDELVGGEAYEFSVPLYVEQQVNFEDLPSKNGFQELSTCQE